jgi:chromosome segregation ATPase
MTEDRDQYIAELREKLEEWNMGLDELQSRVDRAEAEAESRYRVKIDRLRRELDSTRQRMASLEPGGPEQWEEFQEGMEEARELLEEGLEEARRELED